MNLRKYIYLFLSIAMLAGIFGVAEGQGARKKRSKSRTATNYKKKKTAKKSRTRKKKTYNLPVRKTEEPKPDPVLSDSLTLMVSDSLIARIPSKLNPGGLRVNSVIPNMQARRTDISLNENFTYLPVTRELIDTLTGYVAEVLPDSLKNFRVNLNVGKRPLSYYITKVDKLPEKYRKNIPFVTEAHPLVKADKGLENDIVAMWHSHGRYYKGSAGGWLWQRPLLFQTVEDIYTMGFILPYVVPMLENAGAYVMLPRERDTNRHEVIVDNDTNPDGNIYSQPYYREQTGTTPWITGEEDGFIYDLPDFRDTENPFENGTYRQTTTVHHGKPSVAAWYADIPEDGEYAVYVSYKSLPNSTPDAHYTVNYSGGSKEFRVNQTMGGGTWIYLGTFPLTKGYSDTEPIVTLTNISEKGETLVVTADAVKIGGGMGNIARSPRRSDVYYDPSTPDKNVEEAAEDEEENESTDEKTESTLQNVAEKDSTDTSVPATPVEELPKGTPPTFRTSGMPRYLEGARYWLHWAGAPETVYSPYHGTDDYKDDYTCRGHWVNWLAGGSRVLPGCDGLNIPVDMVFALHTDAGKRADDSIVGTLGIYYTQNGDSYRDGTPRINSRMLTDIVMRQISSDIRRRYEPAWTRRSMWDKSYLEARVAEVPSTLIELMSHQNFADMWYGLDPEFRFAVGRSIYKGIGRFLAERKDREFVVQPLPVKDFAIRRTKKDHYRLSWQPTPDPLEESAMPERYAIMARAEGELGFQKIGETSSTHYDIRISDNDIHSFRVVALNRGGASFPSETLALREAKGETQPILIVNGFDRISAPSHFVDGQRAGFDAENDFGVPYIKDISFSGYQTEFNRNAGESFGRSGSNYITQIIAGNTFDYPAIHGDAIAAAGEGFVSCSAGAVESGEVKLSDYKIVDIILGKQKASTVGRGYSGVKFRTFSPQMQKQIEEFNLHGGNLILSGEYVASDLYSLKYGAPDREFAASTLGIAPAEEPSRPRSGKVRASDGRTLQYSNTLNEKNYIVENPDVFVPVSSDNAETLLTFTDTDQPAGYMIKSGKGKNIIFSIPFEAIGAQSDRRHLMEIILDKLK